MDLVQFRDNIKKEYELRMLNEGNTPILDRLELHLKQLDKKYSLETMLNPKNIQHELYLSMVYQIVYPAKKIQKLIIKVDNKTLSEQKNNKQKGIALLKELGIKVLKSHPKYSKYIFNSKEEFYKNYSNNVSLLEVDGFCLSVLHILYSTGADTLEKFQNFAKNINEHFKYEKIKIYANSYYQL